MKTNKSAIAILLAATLCFTSVAPALAAETSGEDSVVTAVSEELNKEGLTEGEEKDNSDSGDPENSENEQSLENSGDNTPDNSNGVSDAANETSTEELSENEAVEENTDGISEEIGETAAEANTAEETAAVEEPSEIDISDDAKAAVTFAGGSGTQSDPYKVSTAAQLSEIRNHEGENDYTYFIQTADIDLSGINWNPIEGKDKVGRFIYDGNGFTISNLKINKTDADTNGLLYGHIGLFSSVSSIKNVTIRNAEIVVTQNVNGNSGLKYIGVIAGRTSYLTNCTAEGTITVTNNGTRGCFIGGLSGGGGYDSDIQVENCNTSVDIDCTNNSSSYCYIGGISGYCSYLDISSSYSKGSISISGNGVTVAGGIIGYTESYTAQQITNCVNYGELYSSNNNDNTAISGIVGKCTQRDLTISNCVNFGYIHSEEDNPSSGIAYLGESQCFINNCYNLGNIKGKESSGRIIALTNSNHFDYLNSNYAYEGATVNESIPNGGLLPSDYNGMNMSAEDIRINISDILDACGGEWVDVNTIQADYTNILSYTPNNGEIDVDIKNLKYNDTYELTICFDGKVTINEGEIRILDLDKNEISYVFELPDSNEVVGEESVLSILCDELSYSTTYCVEMEVGSISIDGHPFIGFTGDNKWTFSTKKSFIKSVNGWPIKNAGESFGYHDNYTIPFSRYGVFMSWNPFQNVGGAFNKLRDLKWNGNCFGMSLLAAAEYLEIIDLNSYTGKQGDGLADYGYEKIVRDSEGKEYCSISGLNDLIAVVETAHISQFSSEFDDIEVFHGNKDYSKLLNYLKNHTNPLLVNLEGNHWGEGHTILIDPSKEPVSLESYENWGKGWYALYIYDSNAPSGKKHLTNPKSWYERESYLYINTQNGNWILICVIDNEEVYSIRNTYSNWGHQNISFYDISKLDESYFTGKLHPSAKQIFFASDIDFIDSGTNVLSIHNNELKGKSNSVDYSVFYSLSDTTTEGTPVRYCSIDDYNITYESQKAQVILVDDQNENCYYIDSDGKSSISVDYSNQSLRVDSIDPTAVDFAIDFGAGQSVIVSDLDLSGGDSISATLEDYKLSISSEQGVECNLEIIENNETVFSGQQEISGTITINTSSETVIASGTCGENLTYTVTGTGDNLTLTISGEGDMYDYAYFDSYVQTAYSAGELPPWVSDDNIRKNIKRIIVKEGVTGIGSGAFSYVGSPQFGIKARINGIKLPRSLRRIGWCAFYNTGCDTITIGSTNNPVKMEFVNPRTGQLLKGNGLVRANFRKVNICLDDTFGEDFQYSAVESVTFIEGTEVIPAACFENCNELQSVKLAKSVTTVAGRAFESCHNLSKVEFPTDGNLETIGRFAFQNCNNLKTITLPESLNIIEQNAFENCTSIENLDIPDSVETIYYSAFKGCTGLQTVKLSSGITKIPNRLFSGCENIESIAIPNSVIEIDSLAFQGCKKLTRIEIPASVSNIVVEYNYIMNTTSAFAGAEKLAEIAVDPNNATYKSYDGCLYNSDLTELLYCPEGKDSIIFAPQTTTVTASAFRCGDSGGGKSKLKELNFKTCAPDISENAFGVSSITATAYYNNYLNTWSPEKCQNYGGQITWAEKALNLSDCNMTISPTSYSYNGTAKKPAVSLNYGEKKLALNTDYTIVYKNNTNAGKATVTATGNGYFTGTAAKTFTIKKIANTITAKSFTRTYSTKAQVFSLGVKIKKGTPTYKSSSKSVTVSKAGKVTVKAKFIGKATITITAPASTNYTATTKKITITVNPTKTALSSVTSPSAGKMTVKWKKNAVGTGYLFQYSTASTFKNVKTVWITNNATVSRTVSGLAKGKKYYVRIRTYKKVGSAKFYSGWSAAKAVTVKK